MIKLLSYGCPLSEAYRENTMSRCRALLISGLCIWAPLTLAQSDNCETLIQRDGVMSIPMQASGRQTVAVLNTGVLPIGISRTLAQDLAYEVEAVPSRNILWSAIPAIVGQVKDVPVKIFNQDLQIEQMYVLENPARFIYLSLLMFNDFVIQINTPDSRLCFLNREAIDLRETSNIRLRGSAGRIAVEVSINKAKPIWLEFQLEYPGAIRLNRDAATELGLSDANGALTASTVDSLQFGPYELGNIAVAYPPENAQGGGDLERLQRMSRRGRSGAETSGVLGYEVLKHFVITLDAEAERMHVIAPP